MGNISDPVNKRIAFYVSDENGIRKGYFSDAELWDYTELELPIDRNGDIVGAFDWMHYNIALTEDIYGVSGEGFSILVYDISNIDRDHTNFDDDPDQYLSNHPELLIKKYFDFHVVEEV